jgi:hypothetical protein
MTSMRLDQLSHELLALSEEIRYVALGIGTELLLRERPGIQQASSSESDRYEELLVNPTLLTLVGERGRIDCGGLEFVVIRYGNFFQLVHPVRDGHVSISVEPDGDPIALVERIREVLASHGSWPLK